MTMKNSFSVLGNNIFSRKFGGTSVGAAEPYISGTFFLWADKLPPGLQTYVAKGKSGLTTNKEVQNVLCAACTGVTTPGGTLNNVEYSGLGGTKWGVPGNVDYGTSFSAKFYEFSGLPIYDIMHGWVQMIRDYRTGVSNLKSGEDRSGYNKEKYSGLFYYFTTTPDASQVEYYACYDGAYPMKDPSDLYGSDIENISRLDVEIEFHCDYIWKENWVYNKCKWICDHYIAAAKSTVERYEYK